MTTARPRSRYARLRAERDTDPATLRCAIYTRQSLDVGKHRGGEERLAVARQEEACRDLITRRGWTVDESLIFSDNDVSATKRRKRPGYTKLTEAIRQHRVDRVVVFAIDRLLRRLADLEELIDLTDEAHVKIVTVSGDLDLETPAGRMNARLLASVAAGEAETKGFRQHYAEMQAVEAGKPPRKRAFGWIKGGMEREPAEADAVAEAYRMALAGSKLTSIADMINARGLTTTLGRPWEPTAVRKMLLSARNAGIRCYDGAEVRPGCWPPLVDVATFRDVEALLLDPDRTTSGGSTSRKWLGASLFLCGICRAPVRTAYREKGTRIYTCSTRKHLSRLADPIDELVEALVVARLSRPDVADLLTAEDPEAIELRDEAEAIRARIRRIEADYADGEIPARVMREQTARQRDALDRINRRLAALAQSSRLAAVVNTSDPATAYRRLDVVARQAVVDVLLTATLIPTGPGRRSFNPETVRITWKGGATR